MYCQVIATFTNNEVFNVHNEYILAEENLNETISTQFKIWFSIKAWLIITAIKRMALTGCLDS
jgi:hypothetical protein